MLKDSDVLIVGGGIIGATCAYYLALEGKRIQIIEQDRFGKGASHGNCGLIAASHLIPLCAPGVVARSIKKIFSSTSPLYVKPFLDIRLPAWLLHFAANCNHRHLNHAILARKEIVQLSNRLYRDLLQSEKIACDFEQSGILTVFKDASGMEEYAHTNNLLKRRGMPAQPLEGKDLKKFEPALRDDVYGGWYQPADSHLRPDLLLPEIKEVLERKEVHIKENCRLRHLRHTVDGHITSAETSEGSFTADTYILATGAWTPDIVRHLNLKLPIQPGKGYSVTMARPGICPKIPCIFEDESVVATPWASGYRLGGTMEFSGLNTRIITRRIQALKTVARRYLEEPIGNPIREEWVGMRPMVYDDLPLIGCVPGRQNLIAATGHGMMGLSMATGTGKIIADIVIGRKPSIDISPFSLNRFN